MTTSAKSTLALRANAERFITDYATKEELLVLKARIGQALNDIEQGEIIKIDSFYPEAVPTLMKKGCR